MIDVCPKMGDVCLLRWVDADDCVWVSLSHPNNADVGGPVRSDTRQVELQTRARPLGDSPCTHLTEKECTRRRGATHSIYICL